MAAAERGDWTETTLAERIRYVRDVVLKVGQNELGKLAGIESGPMSRYATRNKSATPELLAQMADGWGVSYEWLALGRGQPHDLRPGGRSPHPNLEIAIAYHAGRFAPEVVAEVRSMSLKRDNDPPPETWANALRLVQQEHDLERVDPERARQRVEQRERDTAKLLEDIRPNVPT
jgi:hypothetical protein